MDRSRKFVRSKWELAVDILFAKVPDATDARRWRDAGRAASVPKMRSLAMETSGLPDGTPKRITGGIRDWI